MRGRAFFAHDRTNFVADALERGRPWPVAKRIAYDYQTLPELPLPRGSVDMLTVMMGLHHLPQERLGGFLADVWRVLSPGGVFIIREHDATSFLIPLLDLAHSIFNAATGVLAADEGSEVRAFRTVAAWGALARAAGFVDLMVREHDPNDSTLDFMLCFGKPVTMAHTGNGGRKAEASGHVSPSESLPLVASVTVDVRPKGAGSHRSSWGKDASGRFDQLDAAINEQMSANETRLTRASHAFNFFRLPEWMLVHVAQSFAASLDHTPWFRYPFMRHVALYWRVCAAETAAAERAHGIARGVLANSGFHMAVVIGAVLTFIFGQMWLLALPLQLYLGKTTPEEYEDLLLFAQPNETDPKSDRLTSTGRIEKGSHYNLLMNRSARTTRSKTKTQVEPKSNEMDSFGELQNGARAPTSASQAPLDERLAGLHPSAMCQALDVPREKVPTALARQLEGLEVSAAARVPLLVMRGPKHVPFTQVLQELSAMTGPRIHLLAISCLYDATCQVEMRVASPAQRAWAGRQDG